MSDLITQHMASTRFSIGLASWVVVLDSQPDQDGFCSLSAAAKMLGVTPATVRNTAEKRGWTIRQKGRTILISQADVKAEARLRSPECLAGYLTVNEARRRVGTTRSTIYNIAKRHGWRRQLTRTHDLYFHEDDVMAYVQNRKAGRLNPVPEPEEIVVVDHPVGYSSADTIAQRFGTDRMSVYQAASRHDWRRARKGGQVFFCDEDVLCYYDPRMARAYTLEEAARFLRISQAEAALAGRLNNWHRLTDRRFQARDVERYGALQGLEDYLTIQEAAKRLCLRPSYLMQLWRERKWSVDFVRVGDKPVNFVLKDQVEEYVREAGEIRHDLYYSTREIRERLNVSRQRIGQIAAIFGWQRIQPSPRNVLYLRQDVDAYLEKRQDSTSCISAS